MRQLRNVALTVAIILAALILLIFQYFGGALGKKSAQVVTAKLAMEDGMPIALADVSLLDSFDALKERYPDITRMPRGGFGENYVAPVDWIGDKWMGNYLFASNDLIVMINYGVLPRNHGRL